MTDSRETVIVICKGGNYELDSVLGHRVRKAIFGDDFEENCIAQRAREALWANLWIANQHGVPVDDDRGWTRPVMHIMLDLMTMARNSPAHGATRLLQSIFGADASEVFDRFMKADVLVHYIPSSMKDVNRLNAVFDRPEPFSVKHPDARPKDEDLEAPAASFKDMITVPDGVSVISIGAEVADGRLAVTAFGYDNKGRTEQLLIDAVPVIRGGGALKGEAA